MTPARASARLGMAPCHGLHKEFPFERRGRQVNVRVDGPLILNTTQPQVDAALAGLGFTLLPEDELMPHIEAGRLVRVLEDWCPKFNGYHLYYPSRRQPSPAFALVVQMLRR
ncbi:LysR substrate binding domain-containing protein [Cupriavidus alkaliphilus]|nr:LysR substrate binding domain-containing protein [Cupriavidus alkaliphilus]